MNTVPGGFAVADYLREIGRGKKGSRGLTREAAVSLMRAILDGRVDDMALGAVLIALRMKGEELEETLGFRDAVAEHVRLADAHGAGWVVLPSYNGARRSLGTLPLLAMSLARQGYGVLVHAQESEPGIGAGRLTSSHILQQVGVAWCHDMSDAIVSAKARVPSLIALAEVCPPLSALVALRRTLGVRNVAHTLAKLIRPVRGRSVIVSNYTHPEYCRLQGEVFRATRETALSLKGMDGEPVVSVRGVQEIEVWHNGHPRRITTVRAEGELAEALPQAGDVAGTVEWTRAVLSGERAMPSALAQQIESIRAVLSLG